jgi:hypothetical protein
VAYDRWFKDVSNNIISNVSILMNFSLLLIVKFEKTLTPNREMLLFWTAVVSTLAQSINDFLRRAFEKTMISFNVILLFYPDQWYT